MVRIINVDLAEASDALAAIILAKRQRRERLESRIREILEGFPKTEDAPPTAKLETSKE